MRSAEFRGRIAAFLPMGGFFAEETIMAEKTDLQANIPDEAGERPAFARPVDASAGREIGTDDTYSGQEYDSAGQAEWRAEQSRHALPADGIVRGSGVGAGGGSPGEDYDSDSAGGDGSAG
jgi:hypothetical protein